MNLSRRSHEEPELNLTSLIDVVLLLLIFFMVSTTFVDEARITASLHHPAIAEVFELGEAEGEPFLALEYLHGEPVSSWLEQLLTT